MRRAGFSLIEIMVVLTIVVILFGISFASLRGEQKDAEVQAQAEQLAAVLRQVRNRAVGERAAYGVVFNLRNAVGTSGAVLNNWDGGHFYRIIGPGFGNDHSAHSLPVAGADVGGQHNFPHFVENVAASWVSEPYVLPKREVRFLALSDTDEGQRRNDGKAGEAPKQRYYGQGGETTYPRPWFGYYDPATKRLHAWGGYDPTKDFSAFYYEGDDGDVTGSVNPVDRVYDEDWNRNEVIADVDRNGDGDVDDPREREKGYALWRQGEGRAVVAADWMDACIMFTPSGEAQFLEWNRGRRSYRAAQTNPVKPTVKGDPDHRSKRNGLADRAKVRHDGKLDRYTGPGYRDGEDHGEVGHFRRHTGGWHITLAPDAIQDDDRFADVERAIDSIDPAWRVWVGRSGAIRVFRVQRRHSASFLAGRTVWPGDPNTWNDASMSGSNPIWRRCRIGWLHADEGSTEERKLVPTGEPIVDKVTGRMLTERIWWIDE